MSRGGIRDSAPGEATAYQGGAFMPNPGGMRPGFGAEEVGAGKIANRPTWPTWRGNILKQSIHRALQLGVCGAVWTVESQGAGEW